MNSPDPPERLLSAALRAHASGGAVPERPAGPGQAPPPPVPEKPRRLPVFRVLLFAIVLGLLAGGIVGVFSVL